MTTSYGTFTIKDHLFTSLMPSSDAEPRQWTIVVTRGDEEVRRETLEMLYAPVFGADVGDVAALNERVEAIIKELGLE